MAAWGRGVQRLNTRETTGPSTEHQQERAQQQDADHAKVLREQPKLEVEVQTVVLDVGGAVLKKMAATLTTYNMAGGAALPRRKPRGTTFLPYPHAASCHWPTYLYMGRRARGGEG